MKSKKVAINIVVPMAGAGSRFVEAGYMTPKPFIDVAGKTMIERVLDNLAFENARYILIARKEHVLMKRKVVERIKKERDVVFMTVDRLTEGAACTVLLTAKLINNGIPLFMANSDQIVDMDIADYINDSDNRGLDGSILTFYSDHPKWSYAKTNKAGHVIDVREKQVISDQATVGIYYFKKGRDFVNSSVRMIVNMDKSNNEYYVAPAYNYLIKDGGKIGVYEIKESQMHGMGAPEDLDDYLAYLRKEEVITV